MCTFNFIVFFTAFNEMDENHDGKISQAEFVEVLISHYSGQIWI